jgi:hypothetical protein
MLERQGQIMHSPSSIEYAFITPCGVLRGCRLHLISGVSGMENHRRIDSSLTWNISGGLRILINKKMHFEKL